MAFEPKNPGVRGRALKVQELVIPFKITHNATAASVAIVVDEPSILFLKTEGVDRITAAEDSGEVPPSLGSASDASGLTNMLVVIGEPIAKVCSAVVHSRAVASGLTKPCNILAFATGTNAAQKIYLDCTHGVNLSTTDLDGCLVVKYIVDESV